jgi:NADPH:quinone reductase-like Zn-dependent oxidoreductase
VHLTHPEAATYGISAVTAMQGLYTQLDVPWPDLHAAGRALAGSTPIESTEKKQVLIYAGSTGASLYAIQLAKLAGYEVVTTCSPHNFELVKRYGADAVFDYHSPTALDEIRTQYPKLSRAFDGISLSESTTFCAKAVERESGKVVVLLDTRKAGKGTSAEIRWILMYTLLGKPFGFFWPIGPKWGVAEDDRKALVKFYALLPRLVEKVKPIPVKVIEGGFEGLETALDMLRKKKVSGTKVAVQFVGDQ